MGKSPTYRPLPILYSKLHEKTNESPKRRCGIIVVTEGVYYLHKREFKGIFDLFPRIDDDFIQENMSATDLKRSS